MTDYISREAVCYQIAKQATIDGQPRAIKRAAKIVADFPAADVRPVVLCKDCEQADYSGMGNGTVWCMEMERAMQETDFCSRGKREES